MDDATTLPAGPPLPPLVQTVAFHRDPLGVLRRARARHGSCFALRLSVAGPVVVAADSSAVEPLLASDPQRAHAGEARLRVLPMASPRSMFGADGEQHRVARGRIASAFASGVVDRRRPDMAQLAAEHAARWPRGRPFRLLPRVRTLIDDVFVRHILAVSDDVHAQALVSAIRRMLLSPGNPPMPLPGPGNGTLAAPAAALFERRSRAARTLLAEAIDRRRSRPDGDDVIGALLRSSPELATEAMVDELLAVVMAAQEPPSVAVTRVLERLAHHPELDPEDDGVARETLRLTPPALAVLRRLTAPMGIAGRTVPAGASVILPIPLLHRDPDVFPDPEAFRPGRPTDVLEFIPFGGGARRCVGEPLAHAYFAAIVPAIARILRLRPLSGGPERMVVRATTLVPQRGVLVTATRA